MLEDFEFFLSKRSELLKDHNGQFVLIKDKSFQGFYDDFEEAYRKGLKNFKSGEFIIQEITDEIRNSCHFMYLPEQKTTIKSNFSSVDIKKMMEVG